MLLWLAAHFMHEYTMTRFAGGKDKDGERKSRLLNIFGDWTDMVTDLIRSAILFWALVTCIVRSVFAAEAVSTITLHVEFTVKLYVTLALRRPYMCTCSSTSSVQMTWRIKERKWSQSQVNCLH